MFVLSKKRIFKRALLVFVGFVLTILAMFAIIRHVQNKVSANTQDGAAVEIYPGQEIRYGDTGWETNIFTVNTGTNQYYGMCADPRLGTPTNVHYHAGLTSDTVDNGKVKLILYIFFVDTPANKTYLNTIFQTIPESDFALRYAYVHGIVGYINGGDTTGFSDAQKEWLQTVNADLGQMISTNDEKWQAASKYKLYSTTDTGGKQRVMWIEAPDIQYGSITVNKIDSDTGSCTTSAALSLNGTTFALLNSSGETVATKSLSGGSCSVTFENVPYGNYTVRETAAPSGYSGAGDQIVTLNSGSVSISFSNTPNKGKITVNKVDADTGSCTNTAGLSFNGIKFTLINKTGGPVKYGGNVIQNNGTIDTKTLSNGNCSVEFTNLPYGQYTIQESSVPTGYIGDSDKNVGLSGTSTSVTFTNTPKKGKIVVNKTDKDTGSCTPTGNLSLVGTVFDLYNKTGGPVKYGGQSYANNAKIASKTIATGACSVEFDNLPYGAYEVREASASTGYTADTDSKTVTLGGSSAETEFSNTSIKGKVTVNKVDADTGSCTNSDGLSFAGVRFSITNDSTNAVYYNGSPKPKGSIITTKTMSDGDCSVTFENLPYGTYIIKEEETSEGYMLNTEAKTVTIPTNNTVNVSTTVANQPIRGDRKSTRLNSSHPK